MFSKYILNYVSLENRGYVIGLGVQMCVCIYIYIYMYTVCVCTKSFLNLAKLGI